MTEHAGWKVGFSDGSGYPNCITDGNDDVVVSGADDGWGVPQGVQDEAHAHLIAAAPETAAERDRLLKALEGMLSRFGGYPDRGEITAARAAIANATTTEADRVLEANRRLLHGDADWSERI